MLKEDNKILKYDYGEKSMKPPLIIYSDLEYVLKKMSTCSHNNIDKIIDKINEHTPSGYSLFTHCSLDHTKNKLDFYRGKNFVKKFCKDLKEHAAKIINYEIKRNDTTN